MKLLKSAAALAILSMALITGAQARIYNHQDIEVEVLTKERGELRQYPAERRHDGVRRAYIEARDEERYKLRVRNNTERRVGIVIAVDGRNIISGKKSHLKSREAMYILEAGETAKYKGWRTARNRVNKFYFTDVEDSYAAAWNDDSAIGVIAVAVFEERKAKNSRHKQSRNYSSTASRQAAGETGTGMGEDSWSPSRKVKFKARKKAMNKTFIKYAWRSTLCRQQIMACWEHKHERRKNRFWHDDDWGSTIGYAPRHW